MDSASVESKAFRPSTHPHRHHSSLPDSDHHHHHQFHVSPHCPLHSNMILHSKNHSPACPLFNFRPLHDQPYKSNQLLLDIQENMEVEQEEGAEDPVFVLTDEWAEFFAKSEAKRRQEKKQAKRKGKKQTAEPISHQ